jgi:spermidine synthase
MASVEYVELARASSERGEVVLRRRHDPDGPPGSPSWLELRVNGVFVMDSCETTSEVALARAALDRVAEPRSVIVGGLGLGFTVHEVLSDHRVGHVEVAELEDALVRWFRDGTIPHGRTYLADQRLTLTVADVQQVVGEAPPGSVDLVLLDVDNGPDFLVHDDNASLYEPAFLEEVRSALRPGGIVVVWSSSESPRLRSTLHGVFGNCRADPQPVTLQEREETYWLYSAGKAGPDHGPDDEGER